MDFKLPIKPRIELTEADKNAINNIVDTIIDFYNDADKKDITLFDIFDISDRDAEALENLINCYDYIKFYF